MIKQPSDESSSGEDEVGHFETADRRPAPSTHLYVTEVRPHDVVSCVDRRWAFPDGTESSFLLTAPTVLFSDHFFSLVSFLEEGKRLACLLVAVVFRWSFLVLGC